MMTILPFTVRCRVRLLLYYGTFRKRPALPWTVHLPAGEMTARLEQGRTAHGASVLLGGSADNYIQLRGRSAGGVSKSWKRPMCPKPIKDEQGVWNPIYIGTLLLRLQHRLVCTDGNADADLLGRSASIACTGRADCDNAPAQVPQAYYAGNAYCADAARGQGGKEYLQN